MNATYYAVPKNSREGVECLDDAIATLLMAAEAIADERCAPTAYRRLAHHSQGTWQNMLAWLTYYAPDEYAPSISAAMTFINRLRPVATVRGQARRVAITGVQNVARAMLPLVA